MKRIEQQTLLYMDLKIPLTNLKTLLALEARTTIYLMMEKLTTPQDIFKDLMGQLDKQASQIETRPGYISQHFFGR